MKTYIVDFELAGHVKVKARNKEEAIAKAEAMSIQELTEGIQNTHYGENYVEEVED